MAINWRNGRIEAGKLRHRIDLVKISPVQDSTGGVDFSACLVFANVWASVEALDGTESMVGQTEMSSVTWQVVVRYINAAPAWQPLFSYPLRGLIKDPNGYLQQAQTPLQSGASAPVVWNATEGMYTEDGDPSTGGLWLNLGIAPPYTGVTSALIVWWQGRQFEITSVFNPDGRNKMLALKCVEINDSRAQLRNTQSGGLN